VVSRCHGGRGSILTAGKDLGGVTRTGIELAAGAGFVAAVVGAVVGAVASRNYSRCVKTVYDVCDEISVTSISGNRGSLDICHVPRGFNSCCCNLVGGKADQSVDDSAAEKHVGERVEEAVCDS
jgi:hypothetical protein